MKRKTADEMFLLTLHKIAQESGDVHGKIDIRKVMRLSGQKENASKTIVKHLAQANFIKKHGDHLIALTPHGVSAVRVIAE